MKVLRTGSRKIDAILDTIEELGLVVEVESKDEHWGDTTYRNVTLQVTRPQVEATNLLEQMQNSDRITAGWGWIVANGRTPKLVYASQGSLFSSRELSAKILPYAIRGLAT